MQQCVGQHACQLAEHSCNEVGAHKAMHCLHHEEAGTDNGEATDICWTHAVVSMQTQLQKMGLSESASCKDWHRARTDDQNLSAQGCR